MTVASSARKEFKMFSFANNSKYTGYTLFGKYHGYGTMIYPDGSK